MDVFADDSCMRKRKDTVSRRELIATLRRYEARNAELERCVDQQAQRTQELERRICELEIALAKARKNSATSSKPPSSDIVKPPRPRNAGNGKRKIGGQPGHKKHERPPFSPEALTASQTYTACTCPDCGGQGELAKQDARVVQQVELRALPIEITEHRALAYECVACGRVYHAPLPPTVEKGGLVGPRLTALVAYLKGACHASFSTIRKFLRDVVGVPISRGQLSKLINGKVSAALRDPYEELLRRLPTEPRLNVD